MTTESSNNVKKDNIISQSPKNTEVEEGSTVQFIVSKGKTSSKDEDKDSEKSKSSSEDKSDDTQKLRIIQKHITSHIREMTKVKSSSLH